MLVLSTSRKVVYFLFFKHWFIYIFIYTEQALTLEMVLIKSHVFSCNAYGLICKTYKNSLRKKIKIHIAL